MKTGFIYKAVAPGCGARSSCVRMDGHLYIHQQETLVGETRTGDALVMPSENPVGAS